MKLGSLKEGGRDGTLVVVSRDLARAVKATGIAPTMQRALEDWSNLAPRLNAVYEALEAGTPDAPIRLGDYELLEKTLASEKPRALRVWSAASSFGDEAYSTARLLADMAQAGRIGSDWEVLGTDISDRVLRSAIEAVYPDDRLRNVTPERLRRHCLRGSGSSAGLVQMFSLGVYPGAHGLAKAGMAGGDGPPYPAMRRWLRD